MTTGHVLYPRYAVLPSPHSRTPSTDLMLIAASNAERFSGLFAKSAALGWGFRHLAKDVEKLAVELTTRAVETTGNPDPHPRYTELLNNPPPLIGIRVSVKGSGLLIEVWDSDSTPPHGADVHLSAVANVSQQWSCYRPRSGGKVIWVELAPRPIQQPLPQRAAGRFSCSEPDAPVTALQDILLMERCVAGSPTRHRGGLWWAALVRVYGR